MATKGTVSSADFQRPGEMTDMARPPDDADRGDLGRRAVGRLLGGRRGKRRSKRKARK